MWDAVSLEVLDGSSGKSTQQVAIQDDAAKTQRALPPAASKGYSVASIWERTAVLTDTQQSAIEVVGASCSQRPLPSHVQGRSDTVAATPTTPYAAAEGAPEGPLSPTLGSIELASFEDVVLQNSSEFYKWLSELEAARAVETEGKFQRHATVLDGHLAACDGLLSTVDEVLEVFGRLREDHRAVSNRTAALHTTCERLVAEQEALVQAADAIRSKLFYFDELERVAGQFHAAGAGAESLDVLPLLQRLDECLDYVISHPQYADSAAHSLKARQLQAWALGAVRAKVQQALRAAAAAVQQAQREGASDTAPGGSGVAAGAPAGNGGEAALLSIRFRAAAEPSLKGLLQGIEARAGSSREYARLLLDCQRLYCEARLALMRGPVTACLKAYAGQPLAALLRAGCAYLLQVAQLERQLYEQLFAGSAAAASSGSAAAGAASVLAPLIDPLCTLLYDSLRPQLVGVRDVDGLCELADVVLVEVLEGGGAGGRGQAAALLEPVLRRVLADIQERLAYRALSCVKEEVAGFAPGTADLDYPAILERAAAAAAVSPADGEEIEIVPANGGEEGQRAQHAGWYPPVSRAALLLSKLYRTIPPKTFNSLAHEAVAAATTAVEDAQRSLTKAQGPVHGQLFAIKQLLILREQIAPFEADFAVTERDLDFSHMRDYLRRTLSGQLPLFSLGSDSAMMQLVSRAGPRLSESQLDAKKGLERQLKSTCEGFIMHVTKLTVEPMLSFLTKVTAVRVAGGGAGQRPLREAAFATAERVAEVAAEVKSALEGPLPAAVAAMRLYLPTPSTRALLFKPIKSNVAEAHAQIAALLEAEYPAEEAEAVRLTPPQELSSLLDAML